MTQRRKKLTFARTTFFLVLGTLGFAHEVFFEHGERPTVLLACFALMGVPLFWNQDEKQGPS